MSQNFAITIWETLTCLTCHATKAPKIFKDFAFILPLEEISKEGKKREKSVMRKRLIWARVVWQWQIWWTHFMKQLSWVMLCVIIAPSQLFHKMCPSNMSLSHNSFPKESSSHDWFFSFFPLPLIFLPKVK